MDMESDLNKNTTDNEKFLIKEKHHGNTGILCLLRKRGKLLTVICILITEFCERLTYYSISSNLMLFCVSRLGYTDPDAAKIHLVFGGTVMIIPIFGGFISDSVTGKYNAILGGGLLYILGTFLLPVSAKDYKQWFGQDDNGTYYDLSIPARRAYFSIGLVLVALGTAGIKSNVAPYGAQQVLDLGEAAVQSFFSWFYWFINAGALVAFFLVAYIQQNISFFYGFLIPFISMIISVLTFVIASRRYIDKPPTDNIVKNFLGVCCATKCKGFDKARESNGGKYSDVMVGSVVAVVGIIPFAFLLIIYWAVYAQVGTTFYLQSERLNIRVGDFDFPLTFMNTFNTIIVMVLIPVMDVIIYPLLSRHNKQPTYFQKMGFGMILITLGIISAAVVEIYRKKDLSSTGGIIQLLDNKPFNSSNLSIFVQVPQVCFLGSSDVFVLVPALEFAFTQAPESSKGFIMGIYLLLGGVGNYLAQLILSIVEKITINDPWFPKEINNGHLENLFFLMVGLMVLNFLILLLMAKCYKYRRPEPDIDQLNDTVTKPDTEDESRNHVMAVNDFSKLTESAEITKL